MKKKLSVLSIALIIVIALLVLATGFLAIFYFHQNALYWSSFGSGNRDREYSHHFAMIVSEPGNEFWQSVYQSAVREGEENDTYVELFGSRMDSSYSTLDQLNIAIASDVDGILLESDGSEELAERVKDARELGIPVVTLFRDAADSDRICYVGLSYYNLGQQYAEQIIDIVNKKQKEQAEHQESLQEVYITVLIGNDLPDSARTIMLSTMQEYLTVQGNAEISLNLNPVIIHSESQFAAEESIRNLFVTRTELPDIFVCLDQTCSICVYQALVDHNQVGKVAMIGYYTDAAILSGIGKEVIASTTAVDTESLGRNGVMALVENMETGYCSDYYSVDTFVVNKENYQNYMGGAEE